MTATVTVLVAVVVTASDSDRNDRLGLLASGHINPHRVKPGLFRGFGRAVTEPLVTSSVCLSAEFYAKQFIQLG